MKHNNNSLRMFLYMARLVINYQIPRHIFINSFKQWCDSFHQFTVSNAVKHELKKYDISIGNENFKQNLPHIFNTWINTKEKIGSFSIQTFNTITSDWEKLQFTCIQLKKTITNFAPKTINF